MKDEILKTFSECEEYLSKPEPDYYMVEDLLRNLLEAMGVWLYIGY